jgi:putative membrane protein
MKQMTEADRDRIAAAVLEAEKLTTGEIVPMIVARSDDYPGARWRLAITCALLCGFITYYFLGDIDPAWILWAQIPGLYLGYALGNIGAVLRLFMETDRVEQEVHQRALEAFFSLDLHATAERTGILVMASLLEHRVEILADSGINAKVDEATWSAIVDALVQRIKADELTEGFCVAVRDCGAVLQQDFPGSHSNPNEICNKIIIED